MGQSISDFEAWLRRNKSERTIAAYTYTIDRFLRWADGRRLTSESVDDFVSHLLDTGNSNSAAARHLAALKSYFKFMGRKSELDNIETPRVELKIPPFFTIDDVLKIIDHTMSKQLKAMVVVQFNAGLRFSELAALRIEDIDWESGGIIFTPVKKRGQAQPMFIDLEDESMGYLLAYIGMRKDEEGLLFPNGNDKPYPMKKYNKFLREKCEALDIPPKSSHALRHGLATYLSENNLDIAHISIIMRHRNINTTMRYNHARRDKVMENAPKIFNRETEKAKKPV